LDTHFHVALERDPSGQRPNISKLVNKKYMKDKKAKCYNCKHASGAFKIANKTHHQCNHPKHKEGFENGTVSPWDTLQEFYNSCNTHEFKIITSKS